MRIATPPPRRPTVYIVDDDAAVRDSLVWLVGCIDVDVRSFASGEAFLSAYDPAQRGCVVLDICLSGMNGLQVQEALAASGARIPVIVVTGRADRALAESAMNAGARAFFEKPLPDRPLLQAIQRCLAEA